MNPASDSVRSIRLDTGAAALWASAFVIMGMIITAAARLGVENQALADVSEVADLTILTTRSADNEDVLSILDRREERIYVYGVEQGRTVALYQVQDLKELFIQARAAAGGGPPTRTP